MTNSRDKEAYLLSLDEELLKGGVMLSEWCTVLIKDADTAFIAGAYVSVVLTSVSAIETYLRAEGAESKQRLVQLIEGSTLDSSVKSELHSLRRYRNRWVHVEDAFNDERLLQQPDVVETELEAQAFSAMRTLRRVMYSSQSV
jgi:hypothetical protein